MGWLRSFAIDSPDLAKPSWSVDETSATMAWLPSLPFSAGETVLGQRGQAETTVPYLQHHLPRTGRWEGASHS